jgi:putative flavoprotein involved in K+ transport
VLVVGDDNSGAQFLAGLSQMARTTWVTEREPVFLPDDGDGSMLFERATARWQAEREGRPPPEPRGGPGDIVMVPPVREAPARGALSGSVRPFARLEADAAVWADGRRVAADAVVGRVAVRADGQAVAEPLLWLMG